MHRFMKLKSSRSASKADSEAIKENSNSLPLPQLSLPDSKSFRASVILPDLSRRFTLLRANGELLPIDNFRQHLRHELETGHITQEDENILINQYRQQYLNESSSQSFPQNHTHHTSPTHTSSTNSPSPKKSSNSAISSLFSANSSARDVAYIHKTLKMSKYSSANTSTKHLSDEPNSVLSIADNTPKSCPKPLSNNNNTSLHSTQAFNPAQSDCEDEEDMVLTPTQVQRLSLAVDRILDSHLAQNPRTINSQIPSPADAEFRVHEELFRALPDSSPTRSLPLSNSQSNHLNNSQESSYSRNQFLVTQTDSSSSSHEFDSPALSIASAISSSDETLNTYQDCFDDSTLGFEFSIKLDDLPMPSPSFDRQQIVPFIEISYEEVLFIQQALVSPSPHATYRRKVDHSRPRANVTSPAPSQTHGSSMPSSHPSQRNLSTSSSLSSVVDPHSSLSSQEPNHPLLSPRSSALQQRLNSAKAAGIGACHRMRTLRQPPNEAHCRPLESSPNVGPHSPFSQLVVSPSVSDSPEASCFPLTPPTHQNFIPSPPSCADIPHYPDIMNGGELKEARPRNSNSRAGRPLPSTVLFRDVEAQAIAANAALWEAGRQSQGRKTRSPKKKSISLAQIGAPKLLSASVDINAFPLEQTETECQRQNLPQKTKAFSKSTFRLKLGKKRPSESAASQRSTHYSVDEPVKSMKSFGSNPNLRQKSQAAEPNRASHHTCESITGSPANFADAQDHSESPASSKHSHPLNSLRKVMNNHRKSISTSHDPSSANYSASTFSVHIPSEPNTISSHTRPTRAKTTGAVPDFGEQCGFVSKPLSHHPIRSHADGDSSIYHQSDPFSYAPHCNSIPNNQQFQPSPAPAFALVVEEETPKHREEARLTGSPVALTSSSYDVDVNVSGPVEDEEGSRRGMVDDGEVNDTAWLDVQGTQGYEGRSDYASSILDLYGCDTHSREPSRSRRSSGSQYSVGLERSRPGSALSAHDPDMMGRSLAATISATSTTTTGSDRPSSPPRIPNPPEQDILGLVHQLQNSTRFSKFDPNPPPPSSPLSFPNHTLNLSHALLQKPLFNSIPVDLDADAQEEAQVWKQILDG
ncbi:hypothetical protein VP01_191g16 [Puccinia sorghi]|uniref:Uncharacterized protein n=1 Tax=Puccinia sorghi TaxID=27349 RepID=A0A0L6VD66_9BASI|nr:hypothetical protein VP01_191g16 [Puccinia sorghi]